MATQTPARTDCYPYLLSPGPANWYWPRGWDDRRSEFYVPDDLRAYYHRDEYQERDMRRAPRRDRTGLNELDEAIVDDRTDALGPFQDYSQRSTVWQTERAKGVTNHERDLHLHQLGLRHAREHLAALARRAEMNERTRKSQTCDFCGCQSPTTSRVTVTAAAEVTVPGARPDALVVSQLCTPCSQLAAAEVLAHLGAERVHGRPRIEAVRQALRKPLTELRRRSQSPVE